MIQEKTPSVNPSVLAQRTLVNPNAIPRELWQYRQFVCWRYVDHGRAKPDKVPVNPRTLGNAGTTYKNTWSYLPSAIAAYETHHDLNGVGFVLTPLDKFTMVDADDCVQNGVINDFARAIIERVDTYTELSPSGCGLRLLVRDVAQRPALKRSQIEIYSGERFATLTGNVVHNTPIARADLQWIYNQFPPAKLPATSITTLSLSCEDSPATDDAGTWERIFKLDKQGPAHDARFHGDLAGDAGDHSLAVIRLLNCLARWTQGDGPRMDRMIRMAHLDQSKFDAKRGAQTWLQGQILDAISYVRGK